jgi:hypothetical protein
VSVLDDERPSPPRCSDCDGRLDLQAIDREGRIVDGCVCHGPWANPLGGRNASVPSRARPVGWRTWALLAASVLVSGVVLALADPRLPILPVVVAMLVSERARRIVGWTLLALLAALVAVGLGTSYVDDMRDGDAGHPGGGLRGSGTQIEPGR